MPLSGDKYGMWLSDATTAIFTVDRFNKVQMAQAVIKMPEALRGMAPSVTAAVAMIEFTGKMPQPIEVPKETPKSTIRLKNLYSTDLIQIIVEDIIMELEDNHVNLKMIVITAYL
jgi:hypothetical protein